jgi:hypothetical protein
MEAKSRKLPAAPAKIGRHGEYESPKKAVAPIRRGSDPAAQKVIRATPKAQAAVASPTSPRTESASRIVATTSAPRRNDAVPPAAAQSEPAPSSTPPVIQGPPWALAKLRSASRAARKKTCSCGTGPTRGVMGGKTTHTAGCARVESSKATKIAAAGGAASCRITQSSKTRRASFTDLAKPPVTAPPLQPLELVPLPEIEEGPVWWVWDAEFTLQRIGTQRAKVILPFEPAPPQYLIKPQQNFAEYSLPMLFWVQGEGQFFDQPPSFLREMTRLARRAGVAIVILEEEEGEDGSKRATRLAEAIRRTSKYDSQSTLTILRSGVTAKLRRIGDACVGGWSRGGRAAILACGGAASETIPKSIRPRRFISLAPEGGAMVGDPAASLNNLNLAGVTGLVVFSDGDFDVFDSAARSLMPQGGGLAFLRYWCVSHNGFMDAQGDPTNVQEKSAPWAGTTPRCLINAVSNGPASRSKRRSLFAGWGALAAVFADGRASAVAQRARLFSDGIHGLGPQPHDLYFRREDDAINGKVQSVAVLNAGGKKSSESWQRVPLSALASSTMGVVGSTSVPRLYTGGLYGSPTGDPFVLLNDGGRCVALTALAGRTYTVTWTTSLSGAVNRVALSVAAYTQLSFANYGLPLENLGELIETGQLMTIPGDGAVNPEFSLGFIRVSIRKSGPGGAMFGGAPISIFASNPIFGKVPLKPEDSPVTPAEAFFTTIVRPAALEAHGSQSVRLDVSVRMRNTCVLVLGDPRFT